MSYFDEVYLKRMNKDGETRQERVKTRKEKEFNKIYLRKTEYQANIYMINDDESNIICSLQPNKWNESQLISNLMIPKDYNKLHGGDILKIYQKIKDEEYNKIWLVLYCNDDISVFIRYAKIGDTLKFKIKRYNGSTFDVLDVDVVLIK